MITVSLETAKKLKEAGRKKETNFTYNDVKDLFYFANSFEAKYQTRVFAYAPTAQELLDVLPESIWVEGVGTYLLCIYKRANGYGVMYYCPYAENKYLIDIDTDNIAEGVGKVVLRCKENGYLSF